jgi:hypothetical protein
MNISEQFFPYVDTIMKILFAACSLALEVSEEVNDN